MIPTLTGPNQWSAVAMLAVLGPCIAVDLWPELSHCTVSKKPVSITICTQPHVVIVWVLEYSPHISVQID